MRTFKVLSLGGNCSVEEVEFIIRTFAEMYFSVTNKHRRRMKLILTVETNKFLEVIKGLKSKEISKAIDIYEESQINTLLLEDIGVLFLPSTQGKETQINFSLKNGIPILSFDGLTIRNYVDNSCGFLIKQQSREYSIDSFVKYLSMLYFDPEANKMLKKGALNRFKLLQSQTKQTLLPKVVMSKVA